jgi:hypothetical protein
VRGDEKEKEQIRSQMHCFRWMKANPTNVSVAPPPLAIPSCTYPVAGIIHQRACIEREIASDGVNRTTGALQEIGAASQ